MEYDVNRIEFVKTQKTKYIIKTSEHISQMRIDCMFTIVYFQKLLFSLCCNMCEMFYLFRCFAFAELKCFSALPILMSLVPNTL